MSYAYLGPAGTFSETAAGLLTPCGTEPARPFTSVAAVLGAVGRDGCTGAVIPVENSTSGVVPTTLGQLAGLDDALRIVAEVEVPVRFALLGRVGTRLDQVLRVRSHPHALSQCSRWTGEHLPRASAIAVDSTAAAARDLLRAGTEEVAIASVEAAQRYGAAVLAEDIGDEPDAWTRFVLVQPVGAGAPVPTGADRTSLVLRPRDVGAGVLAQVLGEFGGRGVSVLSLHSWPDGSTLRRYRFFVDVDRHALDPHLAGALHAVRQLADVTLLGSYPRASRAQRPRLLAAV